MKVKAAVLWEVGQPLDICEVDLDEPKAGEVLVKIGAAGICRSDRHFMHGDAPIAIPVVLGHEGAGTVVQTGPGVTLASEGDQVILSFVPAWRTLPFLPGGSQQSLRPARRHRSQPS